MFHGGSLCSTAALRKFSRFSREILSHKSSLTFLQSDLICSKSNYGNPPAIRCENSCEEQRYDFERSKPPFRISRRANSTAVVVYLAMRKESEYVAGNAREALNFHISIFIYALCCIPLIFVLIGIPLLIVLGIGSLIFSILAAVKSADGECFHYPLTIRRV